MYRLSYRFPNPITPYRARSYTHPDRLLGVSSVSATPTHTLDSGYEYTVSSVYDIG